MKLQWQSRRFFPDLYGGAEVIGYQIVKQWRELGVDVSVVTENYPNIELIYDEPIEGVNCCRIPTGGMGVLWRIGPIARTGRWIWHQKDILESADIVFASNPECVLGSKLVYPVKPVIYRCEGVSKYFSTFWHEKSSILFQLIEKLAMKLSDAIVVPSDIVKRQILDYVKVDLRRIYVVRYGVDFDRFASAEVCSGVKEMKDEDKFVIVSIGRLSPEKGMDLLIDAFANLKNRNRAVLIIIGDGSLKDELRRYADSYNLNGEVIFTGRVSNPENYLAGADLHVLMSRYETFGLVHLEAMASGVPTISWDASFGRSMVGASEFIINGKTGFCIEPHDINKLSETIDMLIENREFAKQMGEFAKEYVRENFSWRKTAEQYLDIIETILRK